MPRSRPSVALFVLALVAVATAAPVGAAPGVQTPRTASPTPRAEPLPDPLPAVVARVNGEDIPRSDLERAALEVETRAGGPVPADQRAEIYRELLEHLIAFRLLAQEAAAREIAVSDAEITEQVNTLKQQVNDEAAFARMLAERSLSEGDLRAETRTELAVSKLLRQEAATRAPVSESTLQEYIETHPEEFEQPPTVRASHVLIGVEENASAEARASARREAEACLEQIRQGTDFAEVARRHSDDPGTAAAGGDLQYFGPGDMLPEFEAAAFALNAGEVSDVVETAFGFHVIKVIDRQPARPLTLAEVREPLTRFLEARAEQEAALAFVETLRARGTVEVLI